MSSIIDDLIFPKLKITASLQGGRRLESLMMQLSKQFSLGPASIIANTEEATLNKASVLHVKERQFMLQVSEGRESESIRIRMAMLENGRLKQLRSKQHELLFMKEVYKRQPQSATYYVVNRCIWMVMKAKVFTWDAMGGLPLRAYKEEVFRNMGQFEQFIDKYFQIAPKLSSEIDNLNSFHSDLALSQIMSTTISNFDLADDKSEFRQADNNYLTQKQQIQAIHAAILTANSEEKLIKRLYIGLPREIQGYWLKSNFLQQNELHLRKVKSLLAVVRLSNDRRLEDFTYNTVKIEIKGMLDKPIAEGGSCNIFLAQTYITYVNSTDHNVYHKHEEKIQRLLAIKKLKPGLEKKLKHKLDHEKEIVCKFKGGSSPFLPKYYGTEKSSEFSNSLVMEMIHGEQLDRFLSKRQLTICLWTKIFILLNVTQGMRHLTNYPICHLDLKPINVMIGRYLITKIIDFGEAYNQDICDDNYCPGYTFPYVAPEVFRKIQAKNQPNKPLRQQFSYSQKQDVFAFGIIMYEIIFNAKPFTLTHNTNAEVYLRKQILSRIFLSYERICEYGQEFILSTLTSLMVRCMDPDPNLRPKFDWIGVILKLALNSYANSA